MYWSAELRIHATAVTIIIMDPHNPQRVPEIVLAILSISCIIEPGNSYRGMNAAIRNDNSAYSYER